MAQFPSLYSASGIWSLKKQKRAAQGANWPPLVLPDFQFNYVTMLLHGNGTNGAQNNTFLDSSSNAFSLTRNGSITQGTFTPYGSNWSNYFDGSSSLSAYSSFVIGANSFTYEGYAFLLNGNQQQRLFITTGSNEYAVLIRLNATTGNYNFFLVLTSASGYIDTGIPVSGYLNKWTHVALTGDNLQNIKFFLNGSLVFTTTTSTFGAVSNSAFIGSGASGTEYLIGYLSNVRLVIGTEVYTSNFTPPTTPLTAIPNTKLLTCQSNRFIDNSSSALALTVTGSPSVEGFDPFLSNTEYSAATFGGSGYAASDGYLTTTGDCLPKGTVDCCVEFWWYPITHTANVGWCKANLGGGIQLEYQGAGSLASVSFEVYTQGGGGVSSLFGGNAYASAGKFQPKQWNHVAYVRTGDTHSIYCNGVRLYTTTNSIDWQTDTNNLILTSYTHMRYLYGYVSSFRSVVGSSPYNANNATITIPTTQLTAITNTKLLLNFTNGGIIDNSMMNDLQTVGNAQISTAQSKFGGGSMAFDGSGDAVQAPATPNLVLASGSFTIEMWVYFSSLPGGAYKRLLGLQNGSSTTSQYSYVIQIHPSNTIEAIVVNGGTGYTVTSSTVVTTGVWYHIAFVRNGSTNTLFVDGASTGTPTSVASINAISDGKLVIGMDLDGSYPLNGYIDDLRITKGYARYTANFTPPVAPFPDKGAA